MKRIFIFIFCCLNLAAMAQYSDTVATYAFNKVPINKLAKATSVYKVFKKDSATWIRTTADQNLVPLLKETFSDSALHVLDGDYVKYRYGRVSQSGAYHHNERSGAWITYDSTGKTANTKVYSHNKLNGLSTTYWSDGHIQEKGTYLEGKKTGEWTMFYQTGQIALKETYDENNKIIDSAYLDVAGKAISKDSILKAPVYPKGINMFYKYLSRNVSYPKDAASKNVQGNVNLSFTINKLGQVIDVIPVSSPDQRLTKEAIKVLQNSPEWIPGRIFNQPANMNYNVDVGFFLR